MRWLRSPWLRSPWFAAGGWALVVPLTVLALMGWVRTGDAGRELQSESANLFVVTAHRDALKEELEEVRADLAQATDRINTLEARLSPPPTLSASPSPSPTEDPGGGNNPGRAPGQAPPKFTGVHASNYESAFEICRAFGVADVAREYNTVRDPVSAAEGYANDYLPAYRQAPFEGCLDGFLA